MPEVPEPVQREFGVPRGVLDVAAPEVMLDGTRVVSVVGRSHLALYVTCVMQIAQGLMIKDAFRKGLPSMKLRRDFCADAGDDMAQGARPFFGSYH